MPTESNAISFHREDRYNVIKYTDLDKLSHAERRAVSGFLRRIHESVLREGAPARSFLVIESDWPEYEPVWQMIERRMTGQPEVSAAEELDAVLHWRDKHAVAIKERDALQQLLTAADERADTATSLIQRIVANFDTEIEFHEDVEPNDLEHDQVLAEMRVFLAALKPAESSGKPCACPGCDSPRRANSPFCVSHRSAKSRTRGQDPLTAEGLEWLMQNDGLQQ